MDKFYIGPYDNDSGLTTNVKPFLIPDNAFKLLRNAYVFRGRVRKRFGSRYLGVSQFTSRLRVNIGTTDAAGNFNGFVPLTAGVPTVTPAIGQAFSIGGVLFTVITVNPGVNVLLRSDATGLLATWNVTNGQVIINGGIALALTDVYYFPALPVMGLLTFENTANDVYTVIGFDTRFAYTYQAGVGWVRLANGASVWEGNNLNFFWAESWFGTTGADNQFYVTNFNPAELMRRLDGATNTWFVFAPDLDGLGAFLQSARIIVMFKNRLICFNVWENDPAIVQYRNRATWSQIGNPLQVDAWRRDIAGRGGALDAPTSEAIVTVEFVKDRLIVYFERSTYEFVYTGNQALPFAWQKINTELGSVSTFSIVPFDKIALGIGDVGIHAANSSSVERIDTKIPEEIFTIQNNIAVPRVYGIRDYFIEAVYWTFPSNDRDQTVFVYPDQVLLYMYANNTWAIIDDSITVFGNLQSSEGVTWDDDVSWESDTSWDDGTGNAFFREVIAGNQEGYTFQIEADTATSASVLQITNIIVTPATTFTYTFTVIDHNFQIDEETFVFFYVTGVTDSVGNFGLLNGQILQIGQIIDKDTFTAFPSRTLLPDQLAGTYAGGGTIARVSNIEIETKEYNFYAKEDRNAVIQYVNFLTDKTDLGAIQVDFYVSSAFPLSMVNEGRDTGTLVGSGILDTFAYNLLETYASRTWHPVYLYGAEGECIQLAMYFNPEQMFDTDIMQSQFQLHAMAFSATKSSWRLS